MKQSVLEEWIQMGISQFSKLGYKVFIVQGSEMLRDYLPDSTETLLVNIHDPEADYFINIPETKYRDFIKDREYFIFYMAPISNGQIVGDLVRYHMLPIRILSQA